MIQIYAPNNTNFDTNGDEVLMPDFCEASAELGGTWMLDMSHPLDDDGRWKWLLKEAVVAVPTFMGKKQLYRIDEIDKQDTEIVVKAYPVFFDSADEVFLMDKRPTGKNGQEALDIMTDGTKYSGQSNIKTVNTAYFVRRNLINAINGDNPSFIGTWGGEPLYDNFKIIINERAGGNYGAEVRYGKNMDGISFREDMSEVVTRIVPVAFNGRTLSTDYVDSPLINRYAKIYTREIVFEDIKYFEDVSEHEDTSGITVCNSQEELDAALVQRCNEQFEAGIDLYKVTIDIDVIAIENTEEYKDFRDIVRISLGDTVRCYNKRLGITTQARAIRIKWDCITDSIKEVTLGDYEYDIFDKWNNSAEKIENIVNKDGSVMAEKVHGILNGIKTQIKIQSTAAQKQEVRAILFEDLDTESPLYGAMALGTQGLQISNKRTTDGRDWEWSTAFTAKGGYADAIVLGLLSDAAGRNYWNLDTGEFAMSASAKVGDSTVASKQNVADAKDSAYLYADNAVDELKKQAVESVDVMYALGTSTTTAPTSGWSTKAPAWADGKYMWQKTIVTYADGTKAESAATCISGAVGQPGINGTDGKDGVNGKDGTDGKDGTSSYIHIKYSAVETPSDSDMTETPSAYIGVCVNATLADPTTASSYTWSKFMGKDGTQGIPGNNGKDGASSYVHFAYSTSKDGSENFNTSWFEGATYLGACTDNTLDDPTEHKVYAWNLIKGKDGENGADGIGITAIEEQYYLSSSDTECRDGAWSTAQPKWAEGFYIWIRSKITWDNSTVTYTTPVLATAVNSANQGVNDLDKKLTQEEIFNRLTNNGAIQGLFMKDGQLFVNASYILTGILDASKISVEGLEVGTNVTMGENATISWKKVTEHPNIPSDTSDLTNNAGYQNALQVTKITEDTVTAEFINALKVIAGSVEAEGVSTGTLKDAAGNNTWNLDTGELKMKNGLIQIGGVVTKHASDYSNADLERANSIVLGNIIPTADDFEKLDLNGDCAITIADVALLNKLVSGEFSDYRISTRVVINPLEYQAVLKTNGVSIGRNGGFYNSITATKAYLKDIQVMASGTGYVSGKSGSFTTADGRMVTVTNGIITAIV